MAEGVKKSWLRRHGPNTLRALGVVHLAVGAFVLSAASVFPPAAAGFATFEIGSGVVHFGAAEVVKEPKKSEAQAEH